jgi:Zyg-11 family protein
MYRELLHSDNFNVSYFAARIIAHLASDGVETWVFDIDTRQELLQELVSME